ncbi:MAG: DUF1801 domain-containing protein [Planctomycetaceae bacterium]
MAKSTGKGSAQVSKATSKKPAKKAEKTPAKASVKKPATKNPGKVAEGSAAELIDGRIEELGGWRGETLARMRKLILEAVPGVTEEWKWNNPVWSAQGILCTGEAYKQVVKLTFPKGAILADPKQLFNSSLEGNARRAIDIREGEKVDATAFKKLMQAAADLNGSVTSAKPAKKAKATAPPAKPVKLLSGGNPQIAKADGNAPVQAYLAAITGWKREMAMELDALIERVVPKVQRAVKWNSPFYGVEGQGWFASFHVFTNYVKLTFFRGTSLKNAPQGGTSKEARWLDIHQDDFDAKQLEAWVKQAAALPGWMA